MMYTELDLIHSKSILNNHVVSLYGSAYSFYIHYWGGEKKLFTNQVHEHSFFEICYVIDGQGTYIEGGIEMVLEPHTLFMSRPNCKHQIVSPTGLHIIFVAFKLVPSESSHEGVQRFYQLEKSHLYYRQQMGDSPIFLIWTSLIKQTMQPCQYPNEAVNALAYALISNFELVFSDQLEATNDKKLRSSTSTIVHQAKLYIRDNISQDLSLSSVSSHLYISSRHLSRLFNEELGTSFSTYVRKERIRHAVTLLSTKDWSIKRVAEATGFNTVHYFTSVFKDELGEPPGQFIKKLKEETDVF